MDTLEKLEEKVGQILSRMKDLEAKNDDLKSELKVARLELARLKEENEDLKSNVREKDIKVQDRISELLGKLEEVEAEIV